MQLYRLNLGVIRIEQVQIEFFFNYKIYEDIFIREQETGSIQIASFGVK